MHVEEKKVLLGHSISRQLILGLLQEAMLEVMEPLTGCRSTSIEVRECGRRKWGCSLVIVSYFCNNMQRKDMLGMKQRVLGRTACFNFLKTTEGAQSLQSLRNNALQKIKKAGSMQN